MMIADAVNVLLQIALLHSRLAKNVLRTSKVVEK